MSSYVNDDIRTYLADTAGSMPQVVDLGPCNRTRNLIPRRMQCLAELRPSSRPGLQHRHYHPHFSSPAWTTHHLNLRLPAVQHSLALPPMAHANARSAL